MLRIHEELNSKPTAEREKVGRSRMSGKSCPLLISQSEVCHPSVALIAKACLASCPEFM